MSRIGKLPIAIPAGVTVAVSPENVVTVKGPKGELHNDFNKKTVYKYCIPSFFINILKKGLK